MLRQRVSNFAHSSPPRFGANAYSNILTETEKRCLELHKTSKRSKDIQRKKSKLRESPADQFIAAIYGWLSISSLQIMAF